MIDTLSLEVVDDDASQDSLHEWDSLGNYNLLLDIEKNFSIKFKSTDLIKITSINQIITYLKMKKIL